MVNFALTLSNAGLRELLPDELVLYLSEISNHDRGEILTVMADVYDSKDFEAVKSLCLKAAVTRALDPESFRRLSVQMYGSFSEKHLNQYTWDDDLSELDRVLAAVVHKKENS